MPFSDQIYPFVYKGRFYNSPSDQAGSTLIREVGLFFMARWWHRGAVPKHEFEQLIYVPSGETERYSYADTVWVGHSTFLIRCGNLTVLTDPIFGNASWLFPRLVAPGITLENLPSIDVVLISHNHRDHMDEASLRYLLKYPDCTFLVPYGDRAWFIRRGFKNVIECMWWDQQTVRNEKGTVTFTFLPSVHWSQRGLFDKNRSLWGSWMMQGGGKTYYFAGDTAYGNHFSAIARFFPEIHAAFMPIGPCEPNYLMKGSHVNPPEAGQAFLDLKAHEFIPMHWGTFSFGKDHLFLPVDLLQAWWQQQRTGVEEKRLRVLKIGEPCFIGEDVDTADIYREKRQSI